MLFYTSASAPCLHSSCLHSSWWPERAVMEQARGCWAGLVGKGRERARAAGVGWRGRQPCAPQPPPPSKATRQQYSTTGNLLRSQPLHLCPRRWPRRAEERDPGHAPAGAEDLPQWDASLSCSRVVPDIPWRQMGSPGRTTALLGLSLILLLRSQGPGVQGQEFRFGPCRVQGVALRELREAFWTVKDTVVSDVLPRVSFWARLWGFPWVRDSIV